MNAPRQLMPALNDLLRALWGQRNARERLLILLVAVAGVLALLDWQVLQPIQRERKQLLLRIDSAEHAAASLARKSAAALDAPAATRRRADAAGDANAQVTQRIDQLRRGIVSPQKMAERIRELLDSARGLTILSFRNLAPQPLATPAAAVAASTAQAAADSPARPAASGEARAGTLFRHPLALRVAGSYADIVAWLAQIERDAPGVHLSAVTLERTLAGRIEAQIDLFTMGTEATWLVL